MAKYVISYFLNGYGKTPSFVASGGGNFSVGNEMIGVSVDADQFYLPSTVKKLTKAQLLSRAQACGFKYLNGEAFSDQQVIDMVNAYLSENGLEDYA